jgi:1-phosphofructokinase family hexose kinase
MLQRLLDDEGIPHDFVRVRGMTREGVTYLEPDGTWTGVFEPPHRVTGKEGERILNKIDALLPASDYVVCGGSSPGAEVDDLYGEIVTRTNAAGKRSVLDSYGTALTAALRKAPWLVRINKSECEQTLGRTLERDGDFREALRALLEIGVGYCVITDGGRPFFAAGPDGSWRVTPPRIHAVNATGSGDSMLAAFLFGMDKRWDIERCHRFGAAAGAANASKWEVANSTYGEIAAYEASTIVEPLGTS